MDNTSLEIKIKSLNLKNNQIFAKNDHIKYVQDWRGQYKGDAAAILKPINTIEVSRILKLANENKIEMGLVEKVMDKYHLDPEKPNPINV